MTPIFLEHNISKTAGDVT